MKVAKIVLEDRAGTQKDYTGQVYTVRWDINEWVVEYSLSNRLHAVVDRFPSRAAAEVRAASLAHDHKTKHYSMTKSGIFADKKL